MLSYVIGIDIGSATCSVAILHPDKRPLGKATTVSTDAPGFATLAAKLTHLGVPADHILIGMEATGIYWENLYYFLQPQGYQLQLLHPGQTHHFAQQRGLRAKTDRVDATTIARLLLSDEVRPAYVPEEQIASYRELVRMMTSLTQEAARYNIEIQGLLTVLFPEFTQVFADPGRPTARALLGRYPSAQAFVEAGLAAVTTSLHELAPKRYGERTAQRLLTLATQTIASGVARKARERSLQILCAQLGHVQEHLAAVHCLTLPTSAFAAYYRHLIAQGVSKMSALMAVMRKMLTVAYRLLKSGSRYDAAKVWAAPQLQPAATRKEAPAAA